MIPRALAILLLRQPPGFSKRPQATAHALHAVAFSWDAGLADFVDDYEITVWFAD